MEQIISGTVFFLLNSNVLKSTGRLVSFILWTGQDLCINDVLSYGVAD